MAAPITSYTPSTLGYSLDTASKVLSWPSSVVLGATCPRKIWTTKYIFAMNYVHPTAESSKCYKKMCDVECAVRWNVVRRVVWATTIVLPLLDVLAWMIRSLAKFDSAIKANYNTACTKDANAESKLQRQALRKSVKDFARFLLVIAGKKTERPASEQYARFCGHFNDNNPNPAVLASVDSIIDLLDKCYGHECYSGNDLIGQIATTFQELRSSLQKGDTCQWMMGANTTWETLVNNYESFYQVC